MSKKYPKKQQKTIEISTIESLIRHSIEEIYHRHLQSSPSENEKNPKNTASDPVGELIKLMQLLEKYLALCEKIKPEAVEEAVAIDYTLIRNYLDSQDFQDSQEEQV
jgi:hypothetical protein